MVKEADDWKAHENMIREYSLLDLTIKITGETNEDYTIEYIMDMNGFYLKTYFTIPKKGFNEWKAKMQGKS